MGLCIIKCIISQECATLCSRLVSVASSKIPCHDNFGHAVRAEFAGWSHVQIVVHVHNVLVGLIYSISTPVCMGSERPANLAVLKTGIQWIQNHMMLDFAAGNLMYRVAYSWVLLRFTVELALRYSSTCYSSCLTCHIMLSRCTVAWCCHLLLHISHGTVSYNSVVLDWSRELSSLCLADTTGACVLSVYINFAWPRFLPPLQGMSLHPDFTLDWSLPVWAV